MRICTHCWKQISQTARKCKYCWNWLESDILNAVNENIINDFQNINEGISFVNIKWKKSNSFFWILLPVILIILAILIVVIIFPLINKTDNSMGENLGWVIEEQTDEVIGNNQLEDIEINKRISNLEEDYSNLYLELLNIFSITTFSKIISSVPPYKFEISIADNRGSSWISSELWVEERLNKLEKEYNDLVWELQQIFAIPTIYEIIISEKNLSTVSDKNISDIFDNKLSTEERLNNLEKYNDDLISELRRIFSIWEFNVLLFGGSVN